MDIMNRNLLTQFGQRNLKGCGINLLISSFLALVFFLVLFIVSVPEQNSKMKRAMLAPEMGELKYTLHLINPSELGIDHWQIGDYAQYEYRKYPSQSVPNVISDSSTKTLAFHIIDELRGTSSHQYWLKITGMIFFREIPADIYQLVSPNDMRMTAANRRYELYKNYVPSKIEYHDQSTIPFAKLVKLSQGKVETQAGRFECVHYRIELGPDLPAQEIWVNSEVRPLGIVRLQSQNEVLELTSFGQETEMTVPELMQPVIQGISILNHGCTSCHGYDNCHESIFPPK